MADYNSLFQGNLYYAPDQQDLLAAMPSNNPSQAQDGNTPSTGSHVKTDPDSTSPQQPQANGFSLSSSAFFDSPAQQGAPGSGQLGFGTDESPFLDFDPEADFDFLGADQLLFGDLPEPLSAPPPPAPNPAPETAAGNSESRDQSKTTDAKADATEDKGKKRRESDDKPTENKTTAKKPGRKPLTSEPTSVCSVCSPGDDCLTDSLCRSAKHRTAPRSGRSASARRDTCGSWRTRSRRWRRPPRLRTTRTGCCAPRWRGYRSNCASTASDSRGSPAEPASPPSTPCMARMRGACPA